MYQCLMKTNLLFRHAVLYHYVLHVVVILGELQVLFYNTNTRSVKLNEFSSLAFVTKTNNNIIRLPNVIRSKGVLNVFSGLSLKKKSSDLNDHLDNTKGEHFRIAPPLHLIKKAPDVSQNYWYRFLELKTPNYMDARQAAQSTREDRHFNDSGTSECSIERPFEYLPCVAIVGRPNVGKSTIFNLIAKNTWTRGIVDDEVGVTRDRNYVTTDWAGFAFRLIDTGGLVFEDSPETFVFEEMKQQTLLAFEEAQHIIFVVDGQIGVHHHDLQIADFFKSYIKRNPNEKHFYIAVNKCESHVSGILLAQDFWTLGLGEPIPCSGISGIGVGDILDTCIRKMEWVSPLEVDKRMQNIINVSLIGRPNVGKSMLLNRLVGQNRAIVSAMPGTTRDTIDAIVTRNDTLFRFVDSAGIRRKNVVSKRKDLEPRMVDRSLRALKRSDVALLTLDTTKPLSEQDLRLAQEIVNKGKACVVICTKWDAYEDKHIESYSRAIRYVKRILAPLHWATVLMVSGKTGKRCNFIYTEIGKAYEQYRRRISTWLLNNVVQDALAVKGYKPVQTKNVPKIYFVTQVSTAPPTIVAFCNNEDFFTDSDKIYLENALRQSFGFDGTPIRWIWRSKRLRRAIKEFGKLDAFDPPFKIDRSRELMNDFSRDMNSVYKRKIGKNAEMITLSHGNFTEI